MALNTQKVEFLRSAATPKDFIWDARPQVAFAGRSNVGKSSVINRLLNRKNFARVGSAPGKTAHINYFLLDEQLFLVDLPGYGYAKVSRAEKQRWSLLIQSWFDTPGLMTMGVLIVDARHKPSQDDLTKAAYYKAAGKPWLVLANKLDKLKKSERTGNMERIRQTLTLPEDVALIPFSAQDGTGRDALLERLEMHTGHV